MQEQAKLPTLYNRQSPIIGMQDIAILMYKVKNGMAPVNITYLIAVKDEKYNLRNGDFVIPRFDTIKYVKFFVYNLTS